MLEDNASASSEAVQNGTMGIKHKFLFCEQEKVQRSVEVDLGKDLHDRLGIKKGVATLQCQFI